MGNRLALASRRYGGWACPVRLPGNADASWKNGTLQERLSSMAMMGGRNAYLPERPCRPHSTLYMWGAETKTGSNGALYELHGLNKDFTETQATWNNATSTTPWTTAGGDYSATVSDTVASVSEVGRHWWDATSLPQGWVKTPPSVRPGNQPGHGRTQSVRGHVRPAALAVREGLTRIVLCDS
ncbi:DNRLRE domain-containing protein [Streptomyces sp. NPDC001530]|uniref:DNRLRE domain-containing protein n=1 Tax=Streptomyces sp. NPDC001530 TaxID=3364582 RepID=UPI0036B99667